MLNQIIDHTLLKPDASEKDIENLCLEAKHYQFYSVCILPTWIELAKKHLSNSDVKICTVLSFPLGDGSLELKKTAAHILKEKGADEIDMVINLGLLKSKRYEDVQQEIEAVVQAASPLLIKVILEMCLLTQEEKELAANLCLDAKAHFVKTSTGFSKSGATVEDVALLRRIVGSKMGVKASGGIRDTKTAQAMVSAGANRLGLSSSITVVEGTLPSTLATY